MICECSAQDPTPTGELLTCTTNKHPHLFSERKKKKYSQSLTVFCNLHAVIVFFKTSLMTALLPWYGFNSPAAKEDAQCGASQVAANLYSSAYLEQTTTVRVAAVVSPGECAFYFSVRFPVLGCFPPLLIPVSFLPSCAQFLCCLARVGGGGYGEWVRSGWWRAGGLSHSPLLCQRCTPPPLTGIVIPVL